MTFTKSCIWFKMNLARNVSNYCKKKKCLMLGNTFGECFLGQIQCSMFFLNLFFCACTYTCRKSSGVHASLEALKFLLREN